MAENAEQGVERCRAWRPQFIWIDLRMPVMYGMEAVRPIRDLEDGPDVKVAGSDSTRSAVIAQEV